jgi:hypothetical protein
LKHVGPLSPARREPKMEGMFLDSSEEFFFIPSIISSEEFFFNGDIHNSRDCFHKIEFSTQIA